MTHKAWKEYQQFFTRLLPSTILLQEWGTLVSTEVRWEVDLLQSSAYKIDTMWCCAKQRYSVVEIKNLIMYSTVWTRAEDRLGKITKAFLRLMQPRIGLGPKTVYSRYFSLLENHRNKIGLISNNTLIWTDICQYQVPSWELKIENLNYMWHCGSYKGSTRKKCRQ